MVAATKEAAQRGISSGKVERFMVVIMPWLNATECLSQLITDIVVRFRHLCS